ncbi:acyl-CoA dehydrogenase family protein [Lutimaribacter sp. EGI FJ00015]|uniref:Acyl-CoA dehydrogenase family protein n=1 Tax=Lutimaribacter degradans TaxID=2945989 RepID=A0ACC5ZY57_9RHOB|nr:acyl-CoA dehydrogenase family protein [Lutimaribacter sp. EGI FJ00013]MCM2563276.1 acyl-CoA dehydrogenase family protein [Lutimaribacter sp. EGI FJ00013]MCO0614401.1 acyl-CoA dehydrogenase family protein [Lutimaribacter sp. EGI FJ00015]MCO0635998.1 acyl-CoA dehydrogenase family protein [Lutimaribacter sp. EGI FJ00014]
MTLFTPTASWVMDEHRMFADAASRVYADELVPNIEKWNEQGRVDRAFWKVAGDQGLMGGSVPEEYGGAGGGMGFDAITIYEQGAVGDSGWGYSIQSIVLHYLLAYASEEQKQRWVPGLVSGERVAAIAMTEPGTGSDLQSVKTTAEKDGNHYRINGSKTFITNGQTADLIVVVAKTDKNAGAKGVSLIVMESEGTEGFRRGRNLKKLGMKANDTSELFFEDVKVPQTNLLGDEEGQGFYQLMRQLPWERLAIALTAQGCIDFALKETIAYVQERKAFGQRVMDFQNTRFKLAEMKTKAEVLRAFVNDCIARAEDGTLDAATASMAKYWGSQTQNEVMHECLQLFGGYGFMMEYPIARLYADARVQMIYGGTNEIMKELIARSIDV